MQVYCGLVCSGGKVQLGMYRWKGKVGKWYRCVDADGSDAFMSIREKKISLSSLGEY